MTQQFHSWINTQENFSCIISKDVNKNVHRNIVTEQSKCPSIEEWINCGIITQWNITK